jgi:hypothetical protein
MTDKFGKHEHTEQAASFEQSLRDSGIPEQQAGYFNSQLGDGGVLVTVHSGPERASKALSILQQNGANIGTAAAESIRRPSTNSMKKLERLPKATTF